MGLVYIFVSSCIINSVLSVILAIFVFLNGRKKMLNKIWCTFCLAVSFWSLGLGLLSIAPSEGVATFWLKYVHYFGAIFIPSTFLHFCFILVGVNKKRRIIITITYILCLLLQVANFTDLLAGIKVYSPFNFYTKPELFYPVFTFLFFICISYSIFIVIKGMRDASGYKKNQIKYFLLGMTIGFSGGSTAFFPVFNLPLFPLGMYFISMYTIIVSYAIIRYHLMDMNVAIKRSTIYALMIIFVTAVYISVILLFENIFQKFINYNSMAIRICAGVVIALTFLPIRNLIERGIDKLFFRDKKEYLQSLDNLSQSLITILDLRELMGSIVKSICLIMSVEQVCLLFYDPKTKFYNIKTFVGFDNSVRRVRFSYLNKLVLWLKNTKSIAIKGRLIEDNEDKSYSPVITQMLSLKAELAIPLFFDKKLIGILTLGEKTSGNLYTAEDLSVLKSISNQAAIAISNAISYDNLKKIYLGTIEGFIKAIEAKDLYTRGHSDRVVKIAVKIAREMEIPREQIELLQYAGVLHDIGKIGIDNRILNKPYHLTNDEYEEIKKHPVIGENIVSSIKFLEETGKIILYHHERWDGTGYPHQLKEEQIPLLSRIISVADTFDALTSNRPYRPARSEREALVVIKESSGMQFDPLITDYFLAAYSRKKKARKKKKSIRTVSKN